MGILSRLIRVACIWSFGVSAAFGTGMPTRLYTTRDGLPRDDINRIRRDSRGYLWFGTAEGLSMFDGYQFTDYTVNEHSKANPNGFRLTLDRDAMMRHLRDNGTPQSKAGAWLRPNPIDGERSTNSQY